MDTVVIGTILALGGTVAILVILLINLFRLLIRKMINLPHNR